MSKASEETLGELHGAIATGLKEILTEGVVVGLDGAGNPIKAAASPAYYMAAITFAKNNNITADAGKNAELAAFTEALNKRRRASKDNLGQRTYDEAAAQLERDLGGMVQ